MCSKFCSRCTSASTPSHESDGAASRSCFRADAGQDQGRHRLIFLTGHSRVVAKQRGPAGTSPAPRVRAMDVEPIGSIPSPRVPVTPVGVTAELAGARKQLREAAPSDSWEGVLAEVQRLQNFEHMSPLEALQTVYAKLASGWLPPVSTR